MSSSVKTPKRRTPPKTRTPKARTPKTRTPKANTVTPSPSKQLKSLKKTDLQAIVKKNGGSTSGKTKEQLYRELKDQKGRWKKSALALFVGLITVGGYATYNKFDTRRVKHALDEARKKLNDSVNGLKKYAGYEKKMNDLREQLESVLKKMSVLNGENKSHKDSAAKYKDLEGRLRATTEKMEDSAAKYKDLERKLHATTKKMEELQELKDGAQSMVERLRLGHVVVTGNLKKQIIQLTERAGEYIEDIGSIKVENKNLTERVNKLQKEKEALVDNIAKLNNMPAEIVFHEKERYVIQIIAQASKIEQLSYQLRHARNDDADFIRDKTFNELNARILRLSSELEEERSRSDIISKEHEIYVANNERMVSSLGANIRRMKNARDELAAEHKAQIETFQKQIKILESRIAALMREIERKDNIFESEKDDLAREVEGLKGRLKRDAAKHKQDSANEAKSLIAAERKDAEDAIHEAQREATAAHTQMLKEKAEKTKAKIAKDEIEEELRKARVELKDYETMLARLKANHFDE